MAVTAIKTSNTPKMVGIWYGWNEKSRRAKKPESNVKENLRFWKDKREHRKMRIIKVREAIK